MSYLMLWGNETGVPFLLFLTVKTLVFLIAHAALGSF